MTQPGRRISRARPDDYEQLLADVRRLLSEARHHAARSVNAAHADAGQMHLYLNYAREHWTNPGENPPVGLILCAEKDAAVAHYALEGLPNKVLASEYKTKLPTERDLEREIQRTKHALIERKASRPQPRDRQA